MRLKARFGAENVTTKGDIEEKKLLRPSAWFAVDVKTPDGVYHVTDLKNLNVGVDAKDGVGKAWDAEIAFEPKDKTIGDNGGEGRVMFRRGANAVTPAEDAAYMDAVKRGDGRVDVSKPYKVEDVAKERPYLKTNQAAGGAFVDSGATRGNHFPASGVVAARQSLDSLAGIIANRSQKVQSVFGSLRTALENIENGKPIFAGGRTLTAKNFVTSMQALGFDRKEGAKSAYLVVNGELAARSSDHSANAELFVQDGTDNNLSIVIRRSGDKKRFNSDGSTNVVEAVYTRADLDAHPEKLPYIVRDIAEFIATGEYHDTAGAMAYNYSGSNQYKESARDRIYSDALARGDTKVVERMVREAAAKAMPDAIIERGELKKFYRGIAAERDNINWAWKEGGGMYGDGDYITEDKDTAFEYAGRNFGTIIEVFASARKIADWWDLMDFVPEVGEDVNENHITPDTIKKMVDAGFDGFVDEKDNGLVIWSEGKGFIKSADPVTYDDAGNVIPLSQRFNAENPDIRFRRRYTPVSDLQRLADLYGFTPEQADLYNRIVTGGSAQFFADTKAARDLSRRGTVLPEEQAAIDATTQGSAAQRTKGWFRFLTQKPAWNWLRERAQDSMISLRNLESRLRIGKDKSAYYAFDRAYGLAAEDKKRFDEEVLAPMKEELARKGLNDEKKYADFNMLLLALHGPERNRMIAERSDVLNHARQNAGAAQVIDDVLNGRRQLDDNAIDEIANLAGLSARDKARMKRDLSGSGASTAVWNRLMRDFTASGFYNECITPSVPGGMSAVDYAHEIAKRTRELLVSTGRLSRQQADLWERMSPNYMPLMSDFETETAPVQRFFGLGRDKADERGNFDQYGNNEFNHAYGRATVADDPIAAAIRQYDEAVKRSRDNEARQKLAAIVRSNPNMGYVFRFLPQGERDRLAREKAILQNVVAAGTATPAQVAELRRIDGVLAEANRADFAVPTTWVLGENGVKHEVPVVSGLEGGASKPTSIVAFKEDGDLKFVKLGGFTQAQVDAGALSDRDALQVATAAKYQNMVSNALAKRMRTLTGWFSGLRTSFVPTFVFSNFLADTTQATLNLSATYGAEGAKKFWRYRLNSIKAAMDFLDGNYGNNPNQTLRYAQEWAANGGMIGGRSVETLREIRDAIKRDVRMLRGNLKMLGEIKTPADLIKALYGELKSGHPLNALRSIGQFAEYWNSVIEMSTRIASYATVRDLQRGNGKTDAENVADAVSYSRDVTVNFNRKGALGNLINAWWAFGNANMQDIQRSLHALGEGDATRFTLGLGGAGLRVGKAGLKMWGALTALQFVASALGHMLGDDPDDEKEGAPQFKYTPEYNKQSKLGILWGPNIRGIMRSPTYFGASLYDVIFNRKSITEAAKENAALLFSNFVDFAGNTGEEINKAIPSVLRPAWEISQNKNFMGQPIYRKPFFGDKDTTTVRSELGKKDTSALSKGAARALNWVTGGNRNRRGAIDIQPEKISAVAEWFGGGLLKDAREFAQTIADLASFKAPGVKQIPFLNRLGKPRYENSAEYYRAVEKYDAAVAEFDGFAADGDESGMRDAAKDAPYLADKRWNDELKTLKKLKTELQKREVKTETKEDYDAIHAMRMKTQYLFMHRLETPPQGDAEAEGLRTHNRLAERFVKRVKAEDRRAKKREDREVERRKRGIFK